MTRDKLALTLVLSYGDGISYKRPMGYSEFGECCQYVLHMILNMPACHIVDEEQKQLNTGMEEVVPKIKK